MASPFPLDEAAIKASLDAVSALDGDVARAVAQVGYPAVRRRPTGFATLVRIIVAQQLSVKAAATIFGRLEAALGSVDDASALRALDDAALRGVGLSTAKVRYVRALADAVVGGSLAVDALPGMADEAVVASLTAVPGLGVWSAEIYLLFALGRRDVWPVGDLAVRASVGRIKGLGERPTPQGARAVADAWRPHRSAVALLCWHYANNPPA